MKVYFCHKCKSLYIDVRPFICSKCNSNVFIREYKATQKEINKLENKGYIKVVKDFTPMKI